MTRSSKKAHCVIDLQDVVAAGSVQKAIEQWAKDSDDTSSGVVGPAFSTSGPGSGWSRNHNEDDFASEALKGGALYYIDSTDGRLKVAVEAEEGEEGAEQDIGGCWYTEGEWSDESEVRLVVPSEEEAMEHPYQTVAMLQAVIDYHSHRSNMQEWGELLKKVRNLADAFAQVDCDSLVD